MRPRFGRRLARSHGVAIIRSRNDVVDDITFELNGLTGRLIEYRRYLSNRRRNDEMAALIEIKGLGAAVASAKKGIAGVREATGGLSSEAAALVSAVNEVRAQIKQAHDDLKFEAETLGNGGEKISDPQTEDINSSQNQGS